MSRPEYKENLMDRSQNKGFGLADIFDKDFDFWGFVENNKRKIKRALRRKSIKDDIHRTMTKALWFVVWLIILIIFSFWVATFLAFFYIILYPITVCIPNISVVTDFLLKCIQFPKYCAENMMNGTPLF